MFRHILIPLDGSEVAETILSELKRVVAADKTKLTLVRVLDPRILSGYPSEGYESLINYADMKAVCRDYLQTIQTRLQQEGYTVEVVLTEGEPASTLIKVAESSNSGIDLVAMTTHGRAGFAYWTLGSIAERVVQNVKLPVLLVRQATQSPHATIQRILVPLDGSEFAEQALPIAETLARENNASLLLFQATPPLEAELAYPRVGTALIYNRIYEQLTQQAEEYLSKVEQRLREAGHTVTHHSQLGPSGREICNIAEKEQVDLIVMTTHGRTGFSRWFYGSVASQVLRSSTTPVLLIRSREIQPEGSV